MRGAIAMLDHGGPELQSLIEIDNAMADLRYNHCIDTKLHMYSTDCPYHTLHAMQKLYWTTLLNVWIQIHNVPKVVNIEIVVKLWMLI